jgi:hypothetical protein
VAHGIQATLEQLLDVGGQRVEQLVDLARDALRRGQHLLQHARALQVQAHAVQIEAAEAQRLDRAALVEVGQEVAHARGGAAVVAHHQQQHARAARARLEGRVGEEVVGQVAGQLEGVAVGALEVVHHGQHAGALRHAREQATDGLEEAQLLVERGGGRGVGGVGVEDRAEVAQQRVDQQIGEAGLLGPGHGLADQLGEGVEATAAGRRGTALEHRGALERAGHRDELARQVFLAHAAWTAEQHGAALVRRLEPGAQPGELDGANARVRVVCPGLGRVDRFHHSECSSSNDVPAPRRTSPVVITAIRPAKPRRHRDFSGVSSVR